MSQALPPLPAESQGLAPGRGRLAGRRILVVGGGQDDHGQSEPPIGNGRATSQLFAREGAAVVVADLHAETAAATVSRIEAEGGVATAIAADVTDPPQIERMLAAARNALGGLDGLVYNPGIGLEMGLTNVTAEGWDRVFAVNLRGAALTLAAALPVLADDSSVVLISSIASLKPGSRIPAYDASKAGLAGLMRHAALEGAARRIRVNALAPGLIDTSLGRLATLGRPDRARTPVPLGRQGTGWETAYTALFLMCHESAYVTGQVLCVDGGLGTLR